jgi:DNA replication protein DnaC
MTRICRGCGRQFDTDRRLVAACPECAERQHLMTAEQMRQERLARRLARFTEMGLSGRLADMTLYTYDPDAQPEAYETAMQFVAEVDSAEGAGNMALLGPPGTGKTHLAIGLLLVVAESLIRGQYVHWPGLILTLNTSHDRGECERLRLEPLLTTPLLILDDCGRESLTPYMTTWLDRILDARWVGRLATVFTANLRRPELVAWMGPAGASRVQASCRWVTMQPTDRRVRPLPAPTFTPARPDPTEPCRACGDAGWLIDSRMGPTVGAMMRCPVCRGRAVA